MSATDTPSSLPESGAGGDVNLYLSGNYAPVTEEVTAFDLPVVGELPAELSGRYLRNGPNPAGAVDHFTVALRANTGYVPALVGRGQALLELGASLEVVER